MCRKKGKRYTITELVANVPDRLVWVSKTTGIFTLRLHLQNEMDSQYPVRSGVRGQSCYGPHKNNYRWLHPTFAWQYLWMQPWSRARCTCTYQKRLHWFASARLCSHWFGNNETVGGVKVVKQDNIIKIFFFYYFSRCCFPVRVQRLPYVANHRDTSWGTQNPKQRPHSLQLLIPFVDLKYPSSSHQVLTSEFVQGKNAFPNKPGSTAVARS